MAEEMFDAENVGIGKGNPNGYAWVAPKGTKLPADAKEAIPDGFVSLGYVNDEGVVNSTEADSSDIKDWAGRVIKKVQNSFSETYQVGFLEGRTSVLKTYYGDENVEDDGKGSVTVRHNGAFTEERSFVIETLLTETVIKRTAVNLYIGEFLVYSGYPLGSGDNAHKLYRMCAGFLDLAYSVYSRCACSEHNIGNYYVTLVYIKREFAVILVCDRFVRSALSSEYTDMTYLCGRNKCHNALGHTKTCTEDRYKCELSA